MNFYDSSVSVYPFFPKNLTFGGWKVFQTSKMNAPYDYQILKSTLSPWCFIHINYYLKIIPMLDQELNIEISLVGFNNLVLYGDF